ncbi:MAG: hypothetical protein K2X01_09695 [Cyanobacteria bacterium]|nr:hypothetical protein [Cyanobacteriota bacterium]
MGVTAGDEPVSPEPILQDPSDVNPIFTQPGFQPDSAGVKSSPKDALEAKAVLVDIVSDKLEYDKAVNLYTATGTVHVVISEQNSELIADKVIYDPSKEFMIAKGNVIIDKRGQKTYGTYAKIDLTRKSALIDDAVTLVNKVRVKARKAFVDPDFVQLENGKLVIRQADFAGNSANASSLSGLSKPTLKQKLSTSTAKPKIKSGFQLGKPIDPTTLLEPSLGDLASSVHFPLDSAEAQATSTPQSIIGSDAPDFQSDLEATAKGDGTGTGNNFRILAKQVDVVQGTDRFNEINIRTPDLYYKQHKLFPLPDQKFGQDKNTDSLYNMGPPIGSNPDLGGFYGGPSVSFRLGEGVARISPLLSLGGGGRRFRSRQSFEKKGFAPGVGGLIQYQSSTSLLNLAYNSHINQPLIYAEKRFNENRDRIRITLNDDYNQGFFGYERPFWSAQIADSRVLSEFGNFQLSTFASAGVLHDEFYPTNTPKFFVKAPKNATPETAGRIQLQAQIRNQEPLLRIGEHFNLGAAAQFGLSGYSTGDLLGIARAGPIANLQFKKWQSSTGYFAAVTSGRSPFVFDQYYRGSSYVFLGNTVKVNQYLTVGLHQDLNLNRNNARNDLLVGNQFFVLFGPKNMKFNLGYDFIRQRSYFGINFPGDGDTTVFYDRMKIYQPVQYDTPPKPIGGSAVSSSVNSPVPGANESSLPKSAETPSGDADVSTGEITGMPN